MPRDLSLPLFLPPKPAQWLHHFGRNNNFLPRYFLTTIYFWLNCGFIAAHVLYLCVYCAPEHVVGATPNVDWSSCAAAEGTRPAGSRAAKSTCQYHMLQPLCLYSFQPWWSVCPINWPGVQFSWLRADFFNFNFFSSESEVFVWQIANWWYWLYRHRHHVRLIQVVKHNRNSEY